MPITERGRWSSSLIDERGRKIIGSLDERGQKVFGITPIVYDSFSRADSTTLGNTETGQPWQQIGGTLNIVGGQVAGTGADAWAIVDSGVSDCDVQFTYAVYHQWNDFIFRWVDSNNYLFIEGQGIYKKVNGSGTQIGTISTTLTNGDTIKVSLSGTVITIYINGIQNVVLTETFNQTATKHGFKLWAEISRVDDFSVKSLVGTQYTKSLSDTVGITDSPISADKNLLVKDTFTRTNPTSLGTSDTGQSWQILPLLPAGSVFGTNGNVASINTTRGGTDAIIINSGASDCIIDVDIVTRITGTRLFFRAQDYNEAFMLDLGSSSVDLWKWSVATGDSAIANTSSFNSSNVSHVKIELNGSSIKIYFNNSATSSISVTSTHCQNITTHGIGGYNATGIQFDNFVIQSLGGTQTGQSYTKSLSDTISLIDTIAKKVSGYRSLSDSVTFSDSVTPTYTPAPVNTIIVSDNFNRADRTNGLGTADTGQTWIALNGTFGIKTNQAYLVAEDATNFGISYFDVGVSDCLATTTVIAHQSYIQALRIADKQNLLYISVETINSVLRYVIGKRVAGVITILASGGVPAANDIVKTELNGSTIKLYINGTLLLTVTDNFNQTSTKHGIMLPWPRNGILDDFKIETLDTGTPGQSYTKSLNDTFALTDSLTKRLTSYRSVTDAISPNDSLTKWFTGYKSISDTIPTSDSLTKRYAGYKSLSDSVLSADTLQKKLSIAIVETITIGETEYERTNKGLSDTVTATDQLVNDGTKFASLFDAVLITDTIRKAVSQKKTESLFVTETERKTKTQTKTDSITFSDSITLAKGKAVVLSDNVISTDAIRKAVQHLQADTVAVADNLKSGNNLSVTFYEVIVATDSTKFKSHEIIGVIELEGERKLFVYLTGEKYETIRLDAEMNRVIEMDTFLKGGRFLTATNQDFTMYAGDSRTLSLTVYGDNVNLIGSSITWTLFSSNTVHVTKTTQNGGVSILDKDHFQVFLSKSDTEHLKGSYQHKGVLLDTSDNQSTLLVGEIDILT